MKLSKNSTKFIEGHFMKKILVGLLISFVAHGALYAEHLDEQLERLRLSFHPSQGINKYLEKLDNTSPLRKVCTDLSYQLVWNSTDVNNACNYLNNQYKFYGDAFGHATNAAKKQSKNDYIAQTDRDCFENAKPLDRESWECINIILPQENEAVQRKEYEKLQYLKL